MLRRPRSIWNYPFAIAMVSLYFFESWTRSSTPTRCCRSSFFADQRLRLVGMVAWPQVDDGVEVEGMGTRARAAWLARYRRRRSVGG